MRVIAREGRMVRQRVKGWWRRRRAVPVTAFKLDWSVAVKSRMNEHYDHFFRDILGSPRYMMAPMVLRSDLAFRMMGRKYGCDLCYTPMVRACRLIDTFKENGHLDKVLLFHPEDRPLIIQLCGDEAHEMVAAVKIIEDHYPGVCDAIDINLGCPQRCARAEHFGAFLMDEPGTVQSMITALCRQCSLPICAKIRILPTLEQTLRFTDMLVHSGISMLAVHGRRRERIHHDGPADLKCIRKIKQHYRDRHGLRIPIVSNGNIRSAGDAQSNLRVTQCDAVMSACGIMANPFLFDAEKTMSERRRLALKASFEYLELVEEYSPRPAKPRVVNGHLEDFCCELFTKRRGDVKHGDIRRLMRMHNEVNSMRQWIAVVELLAIRVGAQSRFTRTELPSPTVDRQLIVKYIRRDHIVNIRLQAIRMANCKKLPPMEHRVNAMFGEQESSDSESDEGAETICRRRRTVGVMHAHSQRDFSP